MTGSRNGESLTMAGWVLAVSGALASAGCFGPVVRKGGATVRGEGGGFVLLDPLAEEWADAAFTGEAQGQQILVHYTSDRLDEPTAHRFIQQLGEYQAQRERDYERFRTGLATHLGPELAPRTEGFQGLRTPRLASTWYLLARERPPAFLWGIEAEYRFLDPEASSYSDEDLRPEDDLRSQVHSKMHWVIRGLLHSRRGVLPRWIEEGMCDYTSMQYERWSERRFDGAREVMARLMWQRVPVQRQLMDWRHSGISQLHEATWESDLLYRGSLGLVFAIESELGSAGLIQFLRDLIVLSPEKDREAVEFIETRVGKPLADIGRMSADARRELLVSLLDRAREACSPGAQDEGRELALRALGQFPEAAHETVPALQALARCPDPKVGVEGIAGLRYLGRPDLVREALAESSATASERSGELRGEFGMAEKFVHSSLEASRWFAVERDRARPSSDARAAK